MGKRAPISKARRRDKLIGLAIIFFGFAISMALSVWGLNRSIPPPAAEPAEPSIVGIEGFPKKVDPFVVVELARELTQRERFQGFVAQGVGRDGLIDFTKKKSDLRISFQSPKGRGVQPQRQPGTLPDRRFCGVQSVSLNKKGLAAKPDAADRPCSSREIKELDSPAHCTLKQVWAQAKKKKVKMKGTARIEYFSTVSGPAYRFKKDGRSFVVSADKCKKVLTGRASRGSVP